jgi:hypothetical protein
LSSKWVPNHCDYSKIHKDMIVSSWSTKKWKIGCVALNCFYLLILEEKNSQFFQSVIFQSKQEKF